MVLSYLYDISRKLMSHDRRVLRYILMHTLMCCSEDRTFVSGHTDTVRDHLYEDLIVRDLGKFKLLQSQIICSVKSYTFCFHNKTPFFIIMKFL